MPSGEPDAEDPILMELQCCPPFEPAPWDGTLLAWEGKRFIRDRVLTVLHMPINFGAVMRRLDAKVRSTGAAMPDRLCLSDHTSPWSMDVYLAVDREIPGAENVLLSGKFYCRVYEGPYSDTARWCRDFEDDARSRDLAIRTWYMWYTTCPACARKYGKNYVAILGEVA